jgi:hypothetical protein
MKEDFLKNSFIKCIRQLDPNAERKWGKMNVHQMIEHMSDAFRMANGKDVYKEILTPEDKLERAQAFIVSDMPFKENTKNVLMSEIPADVRYQSIEDSIHELENEVRDFFNRFESDKELKIRNPFFGDLFYDQWIGLLYKHCWHHLNQFGMERPI